MRKSENVRTHASRLNSCIDFVCETEDPSGSGRRTNTLRVPRKSPRKRLSIQDVDKIQHDHKETQSAY